MDTIQTFEYWPHIDGSKYLNPLWVEFCKQYNISVNEVQTDLVKAEFEKWIQQKAQSTK